MNAYQPRHWCPASSVFLSFVVHIGSTWVHVPGKLVVCRGGIHILDEKYTRFVLDHAHQTLGETLERSRMLRGLVLPRSVTDVGEIIDGTLTHKQAKRIARNIYLWIFVCQVWHRLRRRADISRADASHVFV